MAGQNIFNSILVKDTGYNRFTMPCDHKLSLDQGYLVPIFWEEAVPGDKWRIGAQALLRFMPMIAPPMHRYNMYIHYFFVPFRILWEGFEDYITSGGPSGPNPSFVKPAFPTVTYGNPNDGIMSFTKLLDYLELPTPPTLSLQTEKVSAMALAAYQRIWLEYFMDENLVDLREEDIALVDGDNSTNPHLNILRRRAWEHDYFTSALPYAQKGASVDIPLGDVTLKDLTGRVQGGLFKKYNDETTIAEGTIHADTITGAARAGSAGEPGSSNFLTAYDPNGTLGTTPTTITDLRRAYALQRYFEKMARSGSRFKEFIKGIFNVNTGDARVDRPEYIGGCKQNVVVGEVLNTTGTDTNPQGNMSGHGISVVNGNHANYYVREQGLIMGIMSVMPKTAYQQGIPKKFLKYTDPTEFYTPDFAHIGEQEIQNREIYAFQGDEAGSQVFGYIPRYAEYKYTNSSVHASLRNDLSFWHSGRIFSTAPALNSTFVECDATKRIFAVEDPLVDSLVAHVLNDVSVARKMPRFGNPI